jgi:hypothetical protein
MFGTGSNTNYHGGATLADGFLRMDFWGWDFCGRDFYGRNFCGWDFADGLLRTALLWIYSYWAPLIHIKVPSAKVRHIHVAPPLSQNKCYVLRDILLNYAFMNPEINYIQGMSDLLAPLLSTLQNEADAYWCFVGLIQQTLFCSAPTEENNMMDVNLVKNCVKFCM